MTLTAAAEVVLSTNTLRVAFVGEVDHGKSTLLGRILLDAGGFTADRLPAPVREGGLAFLLDGLSEERHGLFTLDTARGVVDWEGRRLALIDVPGHLDLLKNMVTGASSADIGVVVVDGEQGVTDQTRRHMRILELLGITTCVCAVTKLDISGYRCAAYARVVSQMADLTEASCLKVGAVVPVSAIDGINVLHPVPTEHPLSWYAGRPLLETLCTLGSHQNRSARLRFSAQALLNRPGAARIVGRVESGLLHPGQELVDQCSGARLQVTAIDRFGETDLPIAGPGDSVGLRFDGQSPPPGSILAPSAEPLSLGRVWNTRVLSIAERVIAAGEACELRFASTAVSGRLTRIQHRWDSSTLDELPCDDTIRFSQIAAIRLQLDRPAAADVIADCPPTGRFMLCDGRGQAIAFGVIDSIVTSDEEGMGGL